MGQFDSNARSVIDFPRDKDQQAPEARKNAASVVLPQIVGTALSPFRARHQVLACSSGGAKARRHGLPSNAPPALIDT